MNGAEIVIYNSVALVLLWCVWHYGWYRFCQDFLRQRLFDIRDEMFDAVAMKRLDLGFSSPAYVKMRRALNAQIRFTHRVDLATIFVLPICRFFTGEPDDRDELMPHLSAIEKISCEKTKDYLKSVDQEVGKAIVKFLAMSSPLFLGWAAAIVLFSVASVLLRGLSALSYNAVFGFVFRQLKPLCRRIESQAEKSFEREEEDAHLHLSNRMSAHA